MNEVSVAANPLLTIDTDFEAYLTAYTRSYQGHMVDGSLDYAYESDYAVRQKVMGLLVLTPIYLMAIIMANIIIISLESTLHRQSL